jgi:class 3 adenylate cyclase
MEPTVRTILFTDLVGSVKMYSKVSDSVAVDLVRTLDDQVRGLLPGHRGQFVKSTGDGLLLSFLDPSGAVRCGLEILQIVQKMAKERHQELSIRVAAHTGPIMPSDDGDLHGNTVNLAARLMSVGGGGEICVSAETWAGMSPDDRQSYLSHGPEVFKGFTRYTYVYKRPNTQSMSDVTLRPQAAEETEISPLLLQALAKSNVFKLDLDHPEVKKSILIHEGETHTIGRAPECSTQVPDKLFSSSHAAFAVVEGILWCFDLQSTNGITYRGRRVKRRVPVATPGSIQFPTGSIQASIPE